MLVLIGQSGLWHFTNQSHCFLRIRPRVLVDVSRIDLSTYVLGYNVSAPILIAPTSLHKLAHPEGLKSSKKDFG